MEIFKHSLKLPNFRNNRLLDFIDYGNNEKRRKCLHTHACIHILRKLHAYYMCRWEKKYHQIGFQSILIPFTWNLTHFTSFFFSSLLFYCHCFIGLLFSYFMPKICLFSFWCCISICDSNRRSRTIAAICYVHTNMKEREREKGE